MNPKIYSNINNYLIIYTPKVIPWGQTDKQTNKRMDGQTDTLAARGLEEFLSSCDFVSVFGSGGK
jgi:hypothetical protein